MSFVSLKSIAVSASLTVSTVIGIGAAPAFANTNFATGVVEYTEGSGITDAQRERRTDTDNALGSYLNTYDQNKHESEEKFLVSKNKDFLSLGLGGEAIFEFGEYFFPEITVWETTWGEKSGQGQHDERLEVLVGNDLEEWVSLGVIENIAGSAYNSVDGATISAAEGSELSNQLFRYVKVIDQSPVPGTSRDGFDVNAIAAKGSGKFVKAVPEPASILGLLTVGVLGAGSLGKRKKKQ
ncbi:MAG: PEP-CTERM sorting domain-containing protein [Cyanobacteria bacterium J06621_15]